MHVCGKVSLASINGPVLRFALVLLMYTIAMMIEEVEDSRYSFDIKQRSWCSDFRGGEQYVRLKRVKMGCWLFRGWGPVPNAGSGRQGGIVLSAALRHGPRLYDANQSSRGFQPCFNSSSQVKLGSISS